MNELPTSESHHIRKMGQMSEVSLQKDAVAKIHHVHHKPVNEPRALGTDNPNAVYQHFTSIRIWFS